MKIQTTFLSCLLIVSLGSSGIGNVEAAGTKASETKPIPVRKTRGIGVDGRFYDDRERGWYWFEVDPDPPEPPIKEPVEAQTSGETAESSNPHKPFSVRWLRLELENARIEAIDNPTPENVEYYGYLEKVSMDKAEMFSIARLQAGFVNQGLDETIDNPVTNLAKNARRDVTSTEKERVLSRLAEKVGIFYFFKSDCQFCISQNYALNEFVKDYGFSILPIAIDGKPMPDNVFQDWTPDRGQSQMLEIEQTPTLYLINPPEEIVILSVGVQTYTALQNRVLQVAHANNWIGREDFEKAMKGLPRHFLVEAIKDVEEIDWNDRDAARLKLRELSKRGVMRASLSDIEPQATPLSR